MSRIAATIVATSLLAAACGSSTTTNSGPLPGIDGGPTAVSTADWSSRALVAAESEKGRLTLLTACFPCTAIVQNGDNQRLVAIDLSADTSTRVTLMTAPGADMGARDAVAAAIIAKDRAVTAIKDSPGFVAQRLRAMVANLGCEMAQIGVASPDEIDLALKLGLNYPLGPVELAGEIGPANLLKTLENMQEITGEDRYRPSQWVRRRALLGLDIKTPD
jgi:hypothetical protein